MSVHLLDGGCLGSDGWVCFARSSAAATDSPAHGISHGTVLLGRARVRPQERNGLADSDGD